MSGPANVAKNDQGSFNPLNTRTPLPIVDGHCHVFGQSITQGEKLHALSQPGMVVFVNHETQSTKTFDGGLFITYRKRTTGRGDVMYFDQSIRLSPRAVVELKSNQWPPVKNGDTVRFSSEPYRVHSAGVSQQSGFVAFAGAQLGKFEKYAAGNDGKNAELVLQGIPSGDRGRAAIPLLLDFGYTPQQMATGQEVAVSSIGTPSRETASSREMDQYYVGGDWYEADWWVWFDKTQHQYSIESMADVAAKFPGEIWPMLPFDPRRALDRSMTRQDGAPVDVIRNAIKNLGFVGVKLYSRCGWMPTNNATMYGPSLGAKLDAELEKLYAYLTSDDVPVLCHTSPTGFPPEGSLILPRLYQEGMISPEGSSYMWSGEASGQKAFEQWCRHFARIGAEAAWNYAHYVQNSASPYAWEPVLRKYPKLRLDLAHSGGELSLICRYGRDRLQTDNLASNLVKNPQVADGSTFKNELFAEAAFHYAWEQAEAAMLGMEQKTYLDETCRTNAVGRFLDIDWIQSCDSEAITKRKSDVAAEVRRQVDVVLGESGWQRGLSDWASTYPTDWTSKIIELVGKYENVYSDIAYISGEPEDDFKKLIKALVDDVVAGTAYDPAATQCNPESQPANAMIEKTFIGTDWYMTEISGMDAGSFWSRVSDVINPKSMLWERWASLNAINWINLRPRMEDMEKWYKKENPGARLPAWWEALKRYYDQNASR